MREKYINVTHMGHGNLAGDSSVCSKSIINGDHYCTTVDKQVRRERFSFELGE